MTTSLIFACTNINAPAGGSKWVRPIIIAEADNLTTAPKCALLAHKKIFEEFWRDD